jgi:hypothetical protein
MLGTAPSVAALGTLARLPSLADIAKALVSKDGRMSKKFGLFWTMLRVQCEADSISDDSVTVVCVSLFLRNARTLLC